MSSKNEISYTEHELDLLALRILCIIAAAMFYLLACSWITARMGLDDTGLIIVGVIEIVIYVVWVLYVVR